MRLIDADVLVNGYDVRKVTEYDEAGFSMNYKAVPVDVIKEVPTVDAVEVVRCKDCEEYIPWLYGWYICGRVGSHHGNTKPDDFCSRGRRKMDAEARDVD